MKTIKEQLIFDEGCVLKPYRDSVGKLTIGIGRNLDDVGISKNEALIMLENDILKVRYQLDTNLVFFKSLNPARQDALINMGFNMGVSKLFTFKKTLNYLSKGDFKNASIECLNSVWASQVGDRAVRISQKILLGV